MTTDPTQQQSDYQQSHSRELSRQRSRPPLEVAGYEARQFLGAGAYGEVWVAVDQNTGRRVAIKFYTQRSAVDWPSLSREVEKLVFLSADRYVVQLLDVGWDADPPYYVMEYVDGGSLQQRLDQDGCLPVGEAVETFREVATGLLHAHGKGVLHCDLKPANILLDQDGKPRLADFGQSRLSHEQTPALGTLFFMAPEQADLTAVPDARWDVYALGALLFCMLTGEPPYRSAEILSEIDASPTLGGRLERYRQKITSSPQVAAHRQLPGVDRELADIMDRCLHVDPTSRFPNVQSVLTALRSRDATKDRRPLLVLGLLGPLLFLLVLGLYSWSTYRTSVEDSGDMLKAWVLNRSRFAAKYVAEAVAQRIDGYFQLVQEQAVNDGLLNSVDKVLADKELANMLGQLADDQLSADEKDAISVKFTAHPLRADLQQHIRLLIEQSPENIASWFITDSRGVQLASAFHEDGTSGSVGNDFSWRSYFHGGKDDLDEGIHHNLPPLKQTRLSTVFQSRAAGTWKIAVSTPLMDAQDNTIGVLALTVELGRLGIEEKFSVSDDEFVVLVDGRAGANRGVILQHPLFNEILSREDRLPDEISLLRVLLDDLPTADDSVEDNVNGAVMNEVALYHDPVAELPDGVSYLGNWIVAGQEVRLESAGSAEVALDTGLVVLVQENYDAAAVPVASIGEAVLRRAILAFLLLLAVGIFLWYLVMRAMSDPNEALRRAGGAVRETSSLHSIETLELPDRLRELPNQK